MAGLDLNALRRRTADIFGDFTKGQKTTLVLAIVAALVGGFVFLQWASAPSWSPLYSGLPTADAGRVTAELDSMGVSYKLEGDTILVGRDAVHQTRLDMSAKGLPADGAPGYDLLDDQGITTSEFKQRVDYQRALEGELTRTIRHLEGVEGANVHLVLPEDDLFTADPVRPTASVLVQTAPDTSLSAEAVRSIVHLVASSVEGLQSSDVTVADQTGRMLAIPGEEGAAAMAGDVRANQTTTFEKNMARSIEDIVSPVVGVGRTRVEVTADLDFDERRTTSETFGEPGTAPVVQESTVTESYAGTGEPVGGVLGPDTLPTGDAEPDSDYSKDQTARTYAVPKVTEEVAKAPGDIRRLSVAVLVDDSVRLDLDEVQQLVATAAGIVPERGDQVRVTQMAFDGSALPQELPVVEPTVDDGQGYMRIIQGVGVVGLVLLVLLLAHRSARRSQMVRYPIAIPEPRELGPSSVRTLDDDDEALQQLDVGPSTEALELDEPDDELVLRSQIGDLIDRQPDEVAQVLRGWLADRRP